MQTLLLLDDELALIKLLRHVLRQYKLIEASGAEQALRLFIGHRRQIDLLLAEVTLPTSSGIQVALLLRSETPDFPVILTSGYPVDDWCDRDAADLKRLGSNSVAILQKPFHPQKLSDAICELIGVPPAEMVRTA
jgi:two-component system, cell cycle sensor histidine kinase and response regulator CckA